MIFKKKLKATTILSALMKNDARPDLKPAWIDMPFMNSIPRLEDAVERLDISKDKEDLRVLRYRSTVLPVPYSDYQWYDVDRIAQIVAKLNPAQFKCLKKLCAAFGLAYEDVSMFFSYLCTVKGISLEAMAENGVPDTPVDTAITEKIGREPAIWR